MAENQLKPAQLRFLTALLEERTIEAACRKADVPRRTADRWRMLPAFRAELERREGEMLDQLARRMLGALPHVESFFLSIMADKTQPPGVRVRAASEYKDLALRLFEARNIVQRLAQIEEYINGMTNTPTAPHVVIDKDD